VKDGEPSGGDDFEIFEDEQTEQQPAEASGQ
jgi:hypothetical protein